MSSKGTNPLMALSISAFALATGAFVYHKRQQRFVPPVAKRQDFKVQIGKHEHNDNLHWIRDDERKAPAVISLLEKENVYAAAQMEHTTDLQKTLYNEFIAHLKEDDTEVPYVWGNYQYYRVTSKGANYPKYARKLRVDSAKTIAANPNKEEVLLDVNKIAEGHVFCSVQSVTPSPDHKLLAFCIDTNGYEKYDIRVLDLATGKFLADTIPNSSGHVEWSDSQTLYYGTLDDAHRPWRVHRHRLGADPKDDQLIYEEKDEKFWVGFKRSLSGEYLFIDSSSKLSSELYYVTTANEAAASASKQGIKLKLFAKRTPNVEYTIDHTSGHFWIVTNEDAKNFKLCRTPTSNTDRSAWQTVIAHDAQRKIDAIDCFRHHVVVYGRKNGFSHIEILTLNSDKKNKAAAASASAAAEEPVAGADKDAKSSPADAPAAAPAFKTHALKFSESIFTCEPGKNKEFDAPFVRVVYESYVTPDTTYDVDLANGQMTRVKELEVPNYDRTLYASELMHARGLDGTQIPISMVYRKDKRKSDGNGTNHMLLYGYGSYGLSYDPQFNARFLSLLDRGLIIATAHIRGGGEMGRLWYDSGKMLTKKNTFNDFIACAQHLVDIKLTEPAKLAISGGSAGGLLMGAVLNARPDLFRVVMTRVPFVDVMVTMNDPTIPLTVTEYEEWGNPAEEKYYDYMLSYSPIDNIKAQAYPAMLVTTGLNDSRVAYWEPVKWVQKLRANKTDGNVILLKCEMIQGHGGSSARYSYMEEAAYNFAFILDKLGFKK